MKRIYIIIIVVLLLFNIRLIYKIKFNSKSDIEHSERNKKNPDQEFIIEQENERLSISKKNKFYDIEENLFFAKDIFKDGSIVFRFSELNCKKCVDAEFNILEKNKFLHQNKINIITHYENKRGFVTIYNNLKKRGLGDISLYLMKEDQLGIPLDKYDTPFYFYIDSTLTMTNFFIPHKENPKLSISYLKFGLKIFEKK